MNTATEKQVGFIKRLQDEREVDEALLDMGRTMWRHGAFTKEAASTLIEAMLEAPKRQTVEPPEGMHKVGDQIFKVQRSPESGRLYAKQWDAEAETFVYAPGAIRTLNGATRMSLEEAQQYGRTYGRCVVCGRTLTNEASIAAGIGPVCAGRL